MTQRQYLRKVIVILSGSGGSKVINSDLRSRHDLKVGFSIAKTISGTPNEASLDIWNLSDQSRNMLGKEYDRVRIEAGYQGTLGSRGNVSVLFDGFIRDLRHERDGADIISRISLGDGDKGYRQGTISKTFPAQTPIRDMVTELHAQMPDVAQGEWKGLDDLPAPRRPVTMVGPVFRELDLLGRTHGFFWNIQDGALEIVPSDGFFNETLVVSPETGMVGVPTITDDGVDVAILLNPAARPNRLVDVRSETLEMNEAENLYRIHQVTFAGDNRDGDYIADISARTVNAGKVTG